MNKRSTSRGVLKRFAGSWRREAISCTAVTLYVVTFFALSFIGEIGWQLYAPMALLALIPIIVGPRLYRIVGVLAFLIAADAGYFELREAQSEQVRHSSPRVPAAR